MAVKNKMVVYMTFLCDSPPLGQGLRIR